MSNNGEDIIRETFKKLGAAIGVQMQMPDAMIANLGAVLQAQIDLLAELQSAGRLIPDDGMALTAEQVEDVRAARDGLRGYRNFDGNARGRVNRLIAAVDALFPATEPAEEETTALPAEVGSRIRASVTRWSSALEWPDANPYVDTFTLLDHGFWEAENDEFTVSPLCVDFIEVLEVLSSPVVPAPTETGPQTLEGPWDRIEDVPKTVGRLTDRDGDIWEWDGDNWVTPETAILPTTYINRKYAPFVAAEEG